MAKASEDILYEAYKQGKVKINDLNEEGKRAIYNKLFDSSKVVSPNAPMARIPKQTETPPASFAMPVVSPTVPTVQKPVSYVEALRDNGSWARDMAGVSPSEAFTQKQPAGLPTQRPTQPSWAQVIGHTINAGSGDYLSSLANAPKTVLQALPGVNPKEDYVVRFLDGVVKHFEDDSAYSQDQLGELSGAKKFVNVGGRALPQIVGSAMMAYGTGGANLAGMGIKQMLPFGASAAGSYARQAELEGADYTQQVLYGITGGAAEMATEMPIFKGMLKTIKGIGALPKVELGARNLIGKYGKIGLDWVKNSVKEAAQEAIIEPITGMAKKAIYDQDMPMYGEGGVVNPDAVAEAGYSGLAMSVLLGGLALPGTLAHQKISNAIETNRTIDGNFIEEVARDMRGEEEAAKASLPQNQEMNSVASAIPNIEPTVPNFETAAPMTEEMAVPEQIMSPSIARTYGGMYRQTAGQPITSSIEQTTTQPIVQQSEPSPMSMVGQKFTLQQFGPVEVVDDSDASKLKLKTASGAELDIGRKAFQNLLIPEAPVVQTAQQVEGLSAPLATLPHDGLEIAPEGKRSQGDVKGALAGQNESQGADLPDDLANNIKLMNDAAEKLGLANEKENKTDTGKHGVSGGVDQKNIGYHAGDLGKADFLASMPGRGTGHFGTGTYFFGSEEAPGYEDYAKKRPVHKVSFEGYNLYKPENLSQGRRLHDLLKNVNKFAFGSSRYRDNLKDIISEAKLLFPDIKANYIVQEIRNLRKYVKENIDKDNTARFEKTKRYDSPSTVFMKNLGYQGVDVRGIKGLDDSEFGSVIYELRNIKPEDSKTEVEGIAEDGQNSQQREKIKPILDKNGKPLVVYHGTNAEFDIFDKTKNQQKTLYGPAFYFTDSKSEGNKYATTYRVGGTPRIIAANLYANNIFDYNNDKLTPEQVERLGWDEWIHITEPTRIGQMDAVVSDWVSSGLQELGYDACKITEKNGSSTYAVFEPNQIKIVPSEQPQQSIQEQVASLAPAIPIGQPKNILKDYQMTLIHTKTKGGTPVWNLAGNTKPFSSWLGKGGAGGTWYGPKKVWSFYGEEDPTEKILKALPPKPVQGETQEQFVDRIVGGIAEKAKDVPRDELKTTILRNLPPSISIAEGEKWIESNLLKTEITQSKPESLMDKAKKVGVAISKDYKKGDRVTWKDRNGKELSGTVQRDPFADDVYISVDTDQIAHAGGVPIGRIEMVWLTNPSLKKIESQSAQEPEEPSQKTPEVVKSTQQEPGIKEAVTNDNAGEDKPRDVRQNGVGTPGETPPADGEGIAPEGEPAGSSTGDGTELQGSNTTTRGTTGKSESPSGKSDLSGESTTSELDQADSVGNAERPTPATRRRDSSQSKRNHRITADDEIGVGGPKAKFRASVEAIKLVKQLEAEGRLATPEEQQTLAKFTGWGPLRQAFEFKRGRWIPGKGYEQEALYPEWTNEFKEMKELLSEQEYSFASNAIQDAFYTSPEVVGAMYETVKRFGFEGGRILEPSMGAGYFFGSMPDNIMNNSKLVGVELDTITGAIAKQLYQKADIRVQGFQETTFPDNFFDLAISNVPFGKIMIHDPAYKEKFKTSRIHNYFFVKALDKVRPGGIVAFITSSGTMNSQDANAMALRHYLSGKADLLGAIRLPGDAFKKLGTQVTTDIIFLRKRKEGERPSGENWLATEDIQVRDKNGNLVELANNEYYQKHPEMMLGEIVPDKLFQNRLGLKAKEGDFEADLKEAVNKLPENIFTKEKIKATEELTPQETVANLHEIKNYSFFMQNGGLFQRQGGVAIPLKISGKAGARMKAFIELREATKDVLATQQLDKSETEIKAAQKKLTTLYDRFVKTYGNISNADIRCEFREDPEWPLIRSLEVKDENGDISKADIFTKRVQEPIKRIDKAETSAEALTICLNERGRVNISRIATLVDKTAEQVINDLKGLIYENPETRSFETAAEYLSGNVRRKLRIAEEAAKLDDKYNENVEALKQNQPTDLEAYQIKPRLGAIWIPEEDIKAFAFEVFQIPAYENDNLTISHNRALGEWLVKYQNMDRNNRTTTIMTSEYGTNKASALELLEFNLNMKKRTVTTTIDQKTVTDVEATEAARARQEKIHRAFVQWVFNDQGRRERLVKKYNEEFNAVKLQEYDGSYLTLPGINALAYKLRKHQLDAVARIIQSGNTLLAHVVGAGKTAEMICAGMELRRLGIAKKPMYIVPNHLIEQWANDFVYWYPNAKVLMVTKDDFDATNRKQLMAKIATGDWDAVVIGHSQFTMIPVAKETEMAFLQEQIQEATQAWLAAKAEEKERPRYGRAPKDRNQEAMIKDLENMKSNLEARYKKLLDSQRDDVVTFEQLGVDQIFLDEAHEFKNLYVFTRMTRVAGIPQNDNVQKTADLLMKIRYLSKLNGDGKGVVFATGTPIANSMTELYTMQRYLQPHRLKEYGLEHFDSWAAMFGEVVTNVEVNTTGTGYRTKERFSKFVNIPELISMFREVADVKTIKHLPEIQKARPELKGGTQIIVSVEPSKILKEFIKDLVHRLDNLPTDKSIDNHLKVFNDGRNSALDLRLVGINYDDPNSKLNKCIENVFRIWKETSDRKATQLVFSDLGTPGKKKSIIKLDIYQDIKQKLVQMGVPAKEVAFIHDAKNDEAKAVMFDKVRRGEIRVLIGSTAKMGAGMNVQDRLFAEHHLDAPYRPADVEQRDGRELRPGNLHKEWGIPVEIYRYVTKDSFDAYNWQIIETKANYISQIMNGDSNVREMEDVDEAAMSAAEMKAAAAGNPLVGERNKAYQKVKKYEGQLNDYQTTRYKLQDKAKMLPESIASRKETISLFKELIKRRKETKGEAFQMKIGKLSLTKRGDAAKALLSALDKAYAAGAFETTITKSNSYFVYSKNVPIGEIGGFKVEAYAESKVSLFNKKEKEYILFSPEIKTFASHISIDYGKPAFSADGAIMKLENFLHSFEARLSNAEQEQQQYEKELTDTQRILAQPFEFQKEYEEAIEKLRQIDEQLRGPQQDQIMSKDDSEKEEADEPGEAVDIRERLNKKLQREGNFHGPAIGMSVRIVKDRSGKSGYQFKNPEVDEAIKSSRGVKEEPAKLTDKITRLWHLMTRQYELLPPGEEFAQFKFLMNRLAKQRAVKSDETLQNLQALLVKFDKYKYELYSYMVVLNNEMENLLLGRNLAFELTPETLLKEYTALKAETERYPEIQEAINERKQLWQTIRNDYIRAMKSIGLDVEKKFAVGEEGAASQEEAREKYGDAMETAGFDTSERTMRENYYRQQVLNMVDAKKAVYGNGKGTKNLTKKGFLKQRQGGFDYNTEYVQAEYEVMSQMLYDTEVARTYREIEKEYSIVNALKTQAIRLNDAKIMGLFESILQAQNEFTTEAELYEAAEKMYRKTLNSLQARGIALFQDLAEGDSALPDTPDRKYADLIEAMANGEELKGELMKKLISYAGWVIKQEDSEASLAAKMLFKGMAKKKKIMQEALGDEYVTWRQLIPEGYAILPIQEGSMFYMAQSIPAEMAEELFSGALEELGVKKDDLKKVFAKGQPFKQLVIKQELVDTIRQMELKKDDRMAFLTVPVKAWKQWTLLYIRKWFKYNARNITGDLDGVIAGNPTSIRKLGQSFKELYEHMVVGKPPAPMLKEFIDRGALKGTMTVQEMGDINKLKMFVDIMEQKGSIKQVPLKIWQSWWKFARISTDFREAILRYASFLDYIDQMNNNRGIPKNFGASKRSEVMALHNTYDRAFKLQNDLLGAYDEISVMGQWLREHLLPFWSWNEVNFRRYTQLIRNAADDHEVASMIGRTVLGKVAVAPLVAYRVGRLVIKVAALWGILIAWNALMFGDLEDDLPEEEQNRPHIIFGRDENGNVKYFSRLGAISDFLDWFGIDGGSMENVKAVLNGEKTIKEVALQMAKSPVNKLMSAVSPFYKTPMELVAGKKTYPDLFKPGNIPDNWLYLAQSVGLDQEYRAIKGLPMRKNYAATWDDVFAYRTDPQENAYYAILDLKSEFERKQGKAQWSGGGAKSEKSDALYWYKQAIRYKDSEAAKKYLLEYMEFGGTGDGLQQSLDSMYPLSGLKKEDQTKFLKTLDSEEKIKLKMAEQYYETIASGSLDLLLKQTAAGNLKSYPGATDNIKLLLKERKSIQSSGSKYKEQELEAINKAIASAVRATIEPKKLK